jgi:hypothetical protein
MLGNLLPGIRQVRTPLATGYLWLLMFWLWLPSHLTEIAPTSGVPGEITRLAHYGGRVAVGIALSFAAYLIGILSQFLNFPFVRLGTVMAYIPAAIPAITFRTTINLGVVSVTLDTTPSPKGDEEDTDAFNRSEIQRKLTLSAGRLSAKGVNSLYSFASEVAERSQANRPVKFKYNLLAYLFKEVPNEGNALVGKEPELYSVYDRLISEYEFRIGISLPLTALITTLALRWSSLWLLAILPLLVLLATGSQQRMAAGDLLADAVRLKRIELVLPAELGTPGNKTEQLDGTKTTAE